MGEGVPLQRDAAELQGQFQGPVSDRGRVLIRGRWDLSEQGDGGGQGRLDSGRGETDNTETKGVKRVPGSELAEL